MRISPSHTASYRIEIDESRASTAKIADAIAEVGAQVRGLDVAGFSRDHLIIDLTCSLKDSTHRQSVRAALKGIDGMFVSPTADQIFLSHVGGKIEIRSKVPLRNRDDFSRAYTPDVARVYTAIHDMPQRAHLLTVRANTVAVVSDGTAVLGLGDIGPEVVLSVMEGKAVLFKEFDGVDAWPAVLDTKDIEEIISIVEATAPTCGGTSLEDVPTPRHFEIEERLRVELDTLVFHDDRHGTAIVVLSVLINTLKLVDKRIENVRTVVSDMGAAGNAIICPLFVQGARDVVGYGRSDALATDETEGMRPTRRTLAEATSPRLAHGSFKEGVHDADVFAGTSHGDILDVQGITTMADKAIIFVLTNPIPEVDPLGAAQHTAVMATDRSDHPNQTNNVLAFPGLFRGLLNAKVKEITTEVLCIAAVTIASVIFDEELSPSYITPGIFDERATPAVSRTVRQAVRDLETIDVSIQEDVDN